MNATTSLRSAASPRRKALAGSLALHSALAFVAACVSVGVASSRSAAPPDVPLAVGWTRTAAAPDEVVAEVPTFDAARRAAPQPAPPDIPDVAVVDAPVEIGRSVADAPTAPTFDEPAFRRDLSARLPARRRAGGGASTGAAGGLGVGAFGVGGPGGSGGGGSSGIGAGGGAGSGLGDGDGDDAGGASSRGATRGPAVVGALTAPTYPSTARSRGWEGRVVLLLSIDARGRVVAVDVAESSGRTALDDAARDAAREWTFAPALCDDAPVAGSLRVPVRFSLSD